MISRNSHLDLTDVRDIVLAYSMLAEHGQSGGVYNVGSGRSVRSGDVLDLLLKRYDAGRQVNELSPGECYLPIADMTRTSSAVDWLPIIPLEKTVDDTMKYWTEFGS